MIPWRLKNSLSGHFPLLYHLAINAGFRGNSKEHWNKQLEDTWDAPTRSWPSKSALIASLTSPSDSILDIACGNGSILRDLNALGYLNLHGLEISDYAIRRLSLEGIRMHSGMLPSIPLPSASLDAVIASQVLEHIVRRTRFTKEIVRILKPGGQAFIFVPDNCLGPIDESEHVAMYNARSLGALLQKHFSVIGLQSMRDVNHVMPILFAHVKKNSGLQFVDH